MYKELLSKELNARRRDFAEFAAVQAEEAEIYLSRLEKIAALADRDLRLKSAINPGAIPSREFAESQYFSVPFQKQWNNHEESREWAAEVLSKRITFAADGSQVYLQKETSLPVGAVQIGWFQNPHDADAAYERGADFQILTPRDLLEHQEEPLNPETRIGERRFHAEIERIREFVIERAGWKERGERMPVAFLDGTLLVSFSLPQTKFQQGFLERLHELVRSSGKSRVPVVGYIDRSFARDIIAMIGFFEETPVETSLYDATLLSTATAKHEKILKKWGDRSVFCLAKRRGLETFLDPASGEPQVGFSYLQTSIDSAPARLDIPAWVHREGMIEEVIDVVRAECVVGLGYPYALESADATALISGADRELFIAALREFAGQEGLDFSVSRKNASKARRR